MRRLRYRQQAGLFRGGELPRLMSMVVMLMVLAMMFHRASDRDTWRYFTGEPASAGQAETESAPHKARVRPHAPVHPPGSILIDAPDVDAQLAMAIEPREQHDPAPNAAPAERPLETTNSAPAAVAEPEEKTGSTAEATEPLEPKPEPPPAGAGNAATAKDDSPAADNPAAAEAAPAAAAPAESAPATAASDESAPATPSAADSAPAKPAPETRPKPLFRPHLPANPETFLQPGTEPEKPVLEPGPLDEDESERREFDHESSVISDRTPLGEEEMFAYFRLLRWSESQTTEQMLKRARGDVRYGDLMERPQDYRGDLLKVKLHIARVRREDTKPGTPFDFQHYYEAIGWNDSTQTWFYFCIFVDLPEGMPVQDRVYEEGTFVGYFLKTFVYLDGKGIKTKAPILIGKMIYEPPPVLEQNNEWLWGCAVAGVLFVLFLARWGWRLRRNQGSAPQIKGLLRRDGLPDTGGEGLAIEDWLEQAESQTAESEINSAASHDLNGSVQGGGLPLRRDHGLDWTEDRER